MLGVLQKYMLNEGMLLAVKSMQCCSQVCICVSGVKSQLFGVMAGL